MASRCTLAFSALLLGCGAGAQVSPAATHPEPGASDEAMRDDTQAQRGTLFTVTLDATRPEVSMGDRDTFGLNVHVTNSSGEEVDLREHEAELQIEGLPHRPLPHPALRLDHEAWSTLAPGQSADASHQNLGVRLFDEPGEYTLRLRVGDALSAPVIIHVTE